MWSLRTAGSMRELLRRLVNLPPLQAWIWLSGLCSCPKDNNFNQSLEDNTLPTFVGRNMVLVCKWAHHVNDYASFWEMGVFTRKFKLWIRLILLWERYISFKTITSQCQSRHYISCFFFNWKTYLRLDWKQKLGVIWFNNQTEDKAQKYKVFYAEDDNTSSHHPINMVSIKTAWHITDYRPNEVLLPSVLAYTTS